MVKNILYDTKLDSQYSELEITESISMVNFKSIKNTLKEINALGVAVVMDDFGTGYSSLAELSNMNVLKLKIDKSFINGISSKFNSQQITKAIIAVAKSLDIKVFAEGIETKEQLKYLNPLILNL
ncbi:EAL domain-containing protein [Clostridium sp. DL1XJH146]